jgi:chemotaxis response regulator CheB
LGNAVNLIRRKSGENKDLKTQRIGRNYAIVCVGGSAGGLEVYIRLLLNLPDLPGHLIYAYRS